MTGSNKEKKRILVIDDEPGNLDIITRYLKESGYQCSIASNGPVGIERSERILPDIILLDIKMPAMDGFEVCKRLKENPHLRNVPVVFLTALDDIENKSKGFSIGGVDYITKPVQKEELLARVKTHLENYLYKNKLEQEVKQRTAELEEINRQLKRSMEFAENLLETANVIIITLDTHACITSFNTYAEKLTGYTREEVMNKNWINLFIPGNDKETIRQVFLKVMENTQEVKEYENSIAIKNGETRYLSWRNNVIRDNSGEITRILSIGMDITRQKQLAEELRQSEKLQAIGQLAGGIAHDFNNQLACIVSFADILQKELTENTKLNLFVNNILVAAKRASDLTSQLLAFARKGKFIVKMINLHTMINEIIVLFKHTIDKRIRITQSLDAREPFTRGDPSQIQNTLMNIVLNSRDAMPEGGELTFTTTTLVLDKEFCDKSPFDIAPGSFILIIIKDSGCGISKENLQKIFEPFFTTKDQGKGTGMGLSAVYGTIRTHNGAIAVESEPGHGTTMKIFLPHYQKS
jgi:two-component system, cell cycle sensor histidine kinase and response regulator CckA